MTKHQAPEVTSELLPVTQADRDFAALWIVIAPQNAKIILAGEWDHHPGVQAAARHRATQPLSLTVDPVLAFEEYWGASKYRTRNMIGYSDKKCLAWEAYSAALQSLSLPVDIDRSGLAQEVES